MKRSTARAARRAHRNLQKQAGMKRPGGASKYARKQQWLHGATQRDANTCRQLAKDGGYSYEADRRLFGFDIVGPRPWL